MLSVSAVVMEVAEEVSYCYFRHGGSSCVMLTWERRHRCGDVN